MLHILNGDATAGVSARTGLAGDVLVWRDILVEGAKRRPARYTLPCAREGWTVAGRGNAAGGKSGLHRAGCWVTPRGGNPTDQCHRKQTAVREGGKGETVR